MTAREGELTDWLVTATAACALLACLAGILRVPAAIPAREATAAESNRERTWVRLAPPAAAGGSSAVSEAALPSLPDTPSAPEALPALGEPAALPALPSLPAAREARPAAVDAAMTTPAGEGATPPAGGPVRLERGQLGGSQPWPEYPAAALRRGESGTVTVRLRVTPAGEVSEARVDTSSGWRSLDEAATTTIRRRWSFPPGAPRDYLVDIRFQIL